jgi:hypothetical protein
MFIFTRWWKPQCWQTAQERLRPHLRRMSGLAPQWRQAVIFEARPEPCSGNATAMGTLPDFGG